MAAMDSGSEKNLGCTHDAAQLPAGNYAAPIKRCQCCGFLFMCIGSGQTTWDKEGNWKSITVTPDPNLCVPCGGRSVRKETCSSVPREEQR